jgi:hypothetical protein
LNTTLVPAIRQTARLSFVWDVRKNGFAGPLDDCPERQAGSVILQEHWEYSY